MTVSLALLQQIESKPASEFSSDTAGAGIVITVGLLGLNAFFVAAEFALISVRRSRAEQLENEGVRGARALRKVLEHLDLYIAGAQVGITLASIGLGIFAEPFLAGIIVRIFDWLPESIRTVVSHTVASAIALMIITIVTVVVGEQLPKSLALRYSERIGLLIVRPLQATIYVLSPFVKLVNGLTGILLKLLRLPPAKGHSISPEELRIVVEHAEASGAMGEHAAEVVRGALRFPNTLVREVMVHRQDVEALDGDAPVRDIYKSASTMKHTRAPVYRGERDRIVGMLHVKDLLKHDPATLDIHSILRPALWVTADTPIPELVNALRRKRTRLALVTDEFGAFAGLVTLEDAAEVVLGEVLDEHEQPRAPIPTDSLGRFVVHGSTRLMDLQESLNYEFNERAVTVGGFIMRFLGRLPEPGERILAEGHIFEVESIAGTQIGKIYCSPAPPAADGESVER
ncbi:MAG: HlyC/CorC family transporter [Planctomycetes bacterium]|nr:HlyC/CorC family transporter [Planctomycetota bacterium]